MVLIGFKSEDAAKGENINHFERGETPKPLILSPVSNTQIQLIQREVMDGCIATSFETHLADAIVDLQNWK